MWPPSLNLCKMSDEELSCDLTPDKTVGVAMDRVLVGSQDVAHDFDKLKECGVTRAQHGVWHRQYLH